MNQVELRYNLATKVMRNGVEVIVATDRNLRPMEPEFLRLLSSTVTRPITLAPHTLTNLMSMVLPTDHITEGQSHLLSILQPSFVTRTYYTTYNYLTTVLKNNTTAVTTTDTTVTNLKTEQYSKTTSPDIQPTASEPKLFSTSPTFQTEVLHTTYTYLNTFLDGDQPFVVSSTHAVANTFVGTHGSELEPSEVFPTTNTYLKTVEFTKTLTDGTDYQVISTEDVVTQVVVTDRPGKKPTNLPITTDVTKTYFVTYTYFSTYIDGDQTKVKSDVSVSSDVTIEKFYIKPKKTETRTVEITKTKAPVKFSSTLVPFTLLATRTYLTTFTYFTTLLQGPNSDKAETKINSRTKVVENTITETIPLEDLNTDYFVQLNSSLHRITGNLVATATLKRGDRIVVTAHRNPSLGSSYQKYEIKPTKTVFELSTKSGDNETHQKESQDDIKIKATASKSAASFSKTKNSLLSKSKIKPPKTQINEITAEALIATEPETKSIEITPTVTMTPVTPTLVSHKFESSSESTSASVTPTSSINQEDASASGSEKVNSVQEKNEEDSKVSESNPSKKKPVLKQPNNQMNVSSLLNLNSLGINGMNVLGPVFNAMAELIHNNLNKNADAMTRRNDTISPAKEPEQVVKKPTTTNINPLLSFVNKFTPATVKAGSEPKAKVTTTRTPVYIPVGSFAKDSEFGESQDTHVVIANRPDNWHEKWKDTQPKNFEKVRPNDTPITILEGGIPISPGQVITTNSDVIIGRPGESGPRPPTFAVKDNVPIDMKPPPLPPHALLQGDDEDVFLGQHSTNQGVDFEFSKEEFNIIPSRPPLPPSKKPSHESHSNKGVRPHSSDRFKGSSHHKNPHFGKHPEYDSGTIDLNPPPVPPPPVRSHDVHKPITINHEQKDESESYKPPNILPIPVHLGPNQNVENYVHPAAINPAVVGIPTLPAIDQILQENIHPIISEPTPSIDVINPNILLIPTVAHIPLNLVATQNTNTVDRSTGHQLLVNIQPSQVANIVIPHGSSTALILSDGKQHSLKGEVIDDPSPHPEPETVGFVGAEPVLKIEGEDIATSLHNEVLPGKIGDGAKQQDNRLLFSNRPQLTTELIKIRPKPNFSDAKLQEQFSLHSGSQQHAQNLLLDQSGQQSVFGQQVPLPDGLKYQQGLTSLAENHRHPENNHRGQGGLQIHQHHHQIEAQAIAQGSGGGFVSHNRDSTKGGVKEVYGNKNYRKHGQNLNNGGSHFFHNIKDQSNTQNVPGGVHFIQNHHLGHNYQINGDGLYGEQNKFVQGNNLVKGGNGIYVDISPPGHLPPRPDVNHLHESHSVIKHQSSINENLSNHQSGHVHDVPLNVQVQLGSGLKKENPLKEILISANTNKHDSIYDLKEKPSEFTDNQNHHKRPILDLPENLSPPPLPKEGNHRPPRPSFIPPHSSSPAQRYPPHPHPTVPEPAEFMIPPPKTPLRPSHKHHPDVPQRPLIPIGAGAPQHYPNPRPEDILIVPHKKRPGTPPANFANDIKQEIHKQPTNIYSGADPSDANDPIRTEYGEEIQESISRPLFPGQLPSELEEFNSSYSHQFSNHKNNDVIKHRPSVEPAQNLRPKGNVTKPENIGQKIPAKSENAQNQNSEDLANMSTHWSLAHQNQNSDANVQTSATNTPPFFSFIKKPSGFVTADKDVSVSGNNKESPGLPNHRDTPNLANHKESSASFESFKITSGTKKTEGTKTGGFANVPPETVVNSGGNKIRIHAVGPSVMPSGFVRNENAVDHKRPTSAPENNSGSKVDGTHRESSTSSNKNNNKPEKEPTDFSNNRGSSSEVSSVFSTKDRTPVSGGGHFESNQHQKEKIHGTNKIQSGFAHRPEIPTNQIKAPGRYDLNKNGYGPQSQPQKFNAPGTGQSSRPKIPEVAGTAGHTIKFDSNKISVGYPSVTGVGIHSTGPGLPPRYPPANGESGLKQGGKRPSGFTTSNKEDYNKQSGGFAVKDNVPSGVVDTKKSPQKFSNAGNDDGHSTVSKKVPSGFTNKNETSLSFGKQPIHNYGNKTVHFYEPKPGFDLNSERDTYNNGEREADKWFASNFGGTNENTNSDAKLPTLNKLPQTAIHRNVSSVPNPVLPTGSDVRITLLTPPKMDDSKSKPEDVMGLSPPPLERPRRPQKPQRPKPPYKFEIPTTPKSTHTPIAIENDFPPVRSPEFNRKPLKPQDIFPPRLPDNFIHHVPDFPIRNHPKPRPITSLPIDVPETSTTEKEQYPLDYEENGDDDPFFAGSEINGHSKPIIGNEPNLSSLRPPPPPPPPQPPTTITNRPKPVTHPKPSTIYQQPTKNRGGERPEKPSQSKHKTIASTERGKISPTSTVPSAIKTTFHTKVSASVTPTAIQPQKDWQDEDIITGSETAFDADQFSSHVTPAITVPTTKKNIVTTLISTGSTTIFGDLYTSGPKQIAQDNSKGTTLFESKERESIREDSIDHERTSIAPTTALPVHTTTLTVTTTMTTVVHSVGHKPFTKTIVLTKTLLSTVFNKVTETKTLVKPTTATIIQTHTIATTKTALVVPTALYPTQTKYPSGGTLKPEIFMADPHAKETMTISVSSSMNKNKNGEDKRKPLGTRLDPSDKDSIIVVMSNKHPEISLSDNENDHLDVVGDDDNEINDSRVVVGGVFDANEEKKYKEVNKDVECSPGCKAKRNELCQRIEGVMKCVCRPGFARMFPDRPCRPTYTYNVQLMLEKLGSEQITYEKNFAQSASPNMAKLASATKEGLDRMIMQSDLRDIYHGVMLNGFQGKEKKTMVDFYVQLSENTDEAKLMDIFKKTLQTSNYSLGGTELFAAREADSLNAEDFNECLNSKFHDCSENARCFNLKGTYTCSCKEGFIDLSENSQFPGRVCSDMIGCEYCGYHGACYSKGEGQITCECFQWYSGERCHINLKVLLIALVTIGAILLALLLVCAVLTCLNRRSRSSTASRTNGSSAGYLRYRGPSSQSLDRRAMIADSSSESSVDNLPYICPPPLPTAGVKKPVLRHAKGPAPRPAPPAGMEQRDRSVTVMIPRAKYRPMPPLSPHLTMSTFSPDKHLQKTAAQIATEQKLLCYLDGNTREERNAVNTTQSNRQTKEQQKSFEYKTSTTNANESPRPAEKKKEPRVFEYEYKISNMLFTEETNSADKRSSKSLDDRFRRHSDSTQLQSDNSNRNMQFRKYSAGALVSAGYEVSAKVGMHHLEEDTTEDEQSAIINTHTMKSSRSQFTTLNRTGDHKTMSEARSYDETTVHPQTRSLKTHYSGSSPSSRVNNDEGHTMIERDLGSTFIMPESQLFKPEADRGSDISNFDSL